MTPKRPGLAIIFLALTLAVLLFLLSKPSLGALGANIFITLAQMAALIGTVLFAFSFMLASRTRLVEEAFGGLDRAYGIHHRVGVWSFACLVAHFVSILIGYGVNRAPVLAFMTGYPVFIVGEIAILTMAAIILTVIYAKIKYQHFMFVQKFFAIPFAFGVYHLLIVSSDVSRYRPLRIFMIAVVALGALAWVYRELMYDRFSRRAEFIIKNMADKGAGIIELALSPAGAPLRFVAGQFAYFKFRSQTVSDEPHPFSFASAPADSDLRFAAKGLGDFTDSLLNAKTGERVTIFGPYGKFFENFDPRAGNILIAGGIGITPFLSLVRSGLANENAMMFYCTNSNVDAVYDVELKTLAARFGFGYVPHESDRLGFVNADVIEKRANGLAGKTVYICGPAGMMAAIAEQLAAKGVPREKIIFESFSY